MAKVRIKLNKSGVRELLKSSSIAQECEKEASKVLNRCGPGFEMEKRNYPERTGYAIYPGDERAYYHNLKHNTILKAVGGK